MHVTVRVVLIPQNFEQGIDMVYFECIQSTLTWFQLIHFAALIVIHHVHSKTLLYHVKAMYIHSKVEVCTVSYILL